MFGYTKLIPSGFYPLVFIYIGLTGFIFFRELINNNTASAISIGLYTMFGAISFYTCFIIGKTHSQQVLIKYFIIALSLHTVFAFLQLLGIKWAWDFPVMLQGNIDSLSKYESAQQLGRVKGLSPLVHLFAILFSGLLLFFVGLTFRVKKSKWMITFIVILFLILVATFSRAAIFGFIFGAAMLWGRRIFKIKYAVMIACGVIIYLSVQDNTIFKQGYRLVTFFNTNNDKIRAESINYAINLFVENPLFGSGFQQTKGVGIGVHSVPVKMLGFYGAFGFILYSLFYYFLATFIFFSIRTSTHRNTGIVLLGLVLLFLLDSTTHTSGLLLANVFEVSLIGLTLGYLYNTHNSEEHSAQVASSL